MLVPCEKRLCHVCDCAGEIILGDCSSRRLRLEVLLPFALTLVWTSFIASGLLHCTVAGAVGAWWQLRPYESPSQLARRAFERAVTRHIDSICFGALLVAMVRTCAMAAHSIGYTVRCLTPKRRTLLQLPIACIASGAETMLSASDRLCGMFNRYALTVVAVKGGKFLEASR